MAGHRGRNLALAAAAVAGLAGAGALAARRRWRDDDEDFTFAGGKELTVETADGAVLAVSAFGDPTDPVVVLAHGYTNSREVWMPLARRLVERGRYVVAYDQRGHAQSTVGSEGMTLERVAADLRDLLQQLDLRDVTVVGHSMGGMTIQALAATEPQVLRDHARQLVLVATCARGLGRPGGNRLVQLARQERNLGRVGDAFGPYFLRGIFGRGARWSHIAASYRWFAETPGATRADFLAAMFAMDLSGALADLGLPTTVVLGTRDTLTPIRLGREMAASIPDVDLVTVDGGGHMLHLEEPDLLADLIAPS